MWGWEGSLHHALPRSLPQASPLIALPTGPCTFASVSILTLVIALAIRTSLATGPSHGLSASKRHRDVAGF